MTAGVWGALLAALSIQLPAQQAPAPGPTGFDIIILNARVFTGNRDSPWRTEDIGIRSGLIAALGTLRDSTARQVIDARALLATPGFIDLHSHADDGRPQFNGLRSANPRRRAALNLITQGITTVVVNQDGRSPLPIARQATRLRQLGTGPNVILLAGHGSIRRQVMGTDLRRRATAAEISVMRETVRQAMEEGAWGLSAGLEYIPGRYGDTEELVQLVRAIAPYHGIYIAHQRSEGHDPLWYTPGLPDSNPPTLLDAIRETIEIGDRTGVTVIASHIKAKGVGFWGRSRDAIRLIAGARQRGVDIWADQYPYTTTGGDGNAVLIPFWVFRKGRSEHPQADFAQALDYALQNPNDRRDEGERPQSLPRDRKLLYQKAELLNRARRKRFTHVRITFPGHRRPGLSSPRWDPRLCVRARSSGQTSNRLGSTGYPKTLPSGNDSFPGRSYRSSPFEILSRCQRTTSPIPSCREIRGCHPSAWRIRVPSKQIRWISPGREEA